MKQQPDNVQYIYSTGPRGTTVTQADGAESIKFHTVSVRSMCNTAAHVECRILHNGRQDSIDVFLFCSVGNRVYDGMELHMCVCSVFAESSPFN